jgi:hypothetical protein
MAITGLALAAVFLVCCCQSLSGPARLRLWGDLPEQYDRQICRAVLASTNGVRKGVDMDADTFAIVVERIERHPSLLQQLLSEYRETVGRVSPGDSEDDGFILRLARDMRDYWNEKGFQGRRALNLLLLASMFGKEEWVHGATWHDADERLSDALDWVVENHDFVVFDCEMKVFVIDESAKSAGKPVSKKLQVWSWCDGQDGSREGR